MKKIAALLCGAVMAFSSACSATVASEKIALDKIEPGIGASQLISMYGQPNRRKGDDWIYSNFKVELDDGQSFVEEVETKSGELATPDGVRVGQSAAVLNRTFGTADRHEIEHDEEEYEYYSHDYSRKIEFKVVNGVIAKITCEYRNH